VYAYTELLDSVIKALKNTQANAIKTQNRPIVFIMLATACKGTVIAFKHKQANEDKALVSAKRCNGFRFEGNTSNKTRRSSISESNSACVVPAAINNMQIKYV
jgi:hypothetical protein